MPLKVGQNTMPPLAGSTVPSNSSLLKSIYGGIDLVRPISIYAVSPCSNLHAAQINKPHGYKVCCNYEGMCWSPDNTSSDNSMTMPSKKDLDSITKWTKEIDQDQSVDVLLDSEVTKAKLVSCLLILLITTFIAT